MSKHSNFQKKHACLILAKTCLLKLSDKETGATSLCLFSSLYCWVWVYYCWVNVYIFGLSSKDVLNRYLPVFLCLWYWLWTNMYCWKRDFFVSNLLCLMLQLMLNFTNLVSVSTPFLSFYRKFCLLQPFKSAI